MNQPSAVRLTSSSLLARNTTLNLIGEGWTFIVLVAAMPKVVAFLGETGFGLFSLAWVVISYLNFLDIGVSRAATKFISEHLVEQDCDSVHSVIRAALLSNVTLGLIGALFVACTTPYLVHTAFKISPDLQHQARVTFYIIAIAVPVLLVQGVFRGVLSSFQRFGWINVVNAVAVTTQWVLAAVLSWRGFGVALVVLVTVVVRVIATLAFGGVVWRSLPDFRLLKKDDLRIALKLLRFGSWVTVSQVISPVLVYFDRMLIASFVSLSAVTLYSVPFEAITRLRVIPSNMMSTLYPAFSERGLSGLEVQFQNLYERSIRYLSLLLLPGILFLLFFGSDVLSLWMGASFARQTTAVLEVLALGVLANGIAYVPYNMLQAAGRPDLTGKFHLLELPVYIAMCFALIPRWGIIGAALASTVRFVLDAGLLFWGVRKYCGCSLRAFWTNAFRRLIGLTSTFAVGLFIVRDAISGPWGRIGGGTFCLTVYFAAAWFLVIDQREKPSLNAAFRIFRSQPAS